MSACMSLTCFDNKCGPGAATGPHLYRETSPVFSGSVPVMTRMPLIVMKENHMFDWKQFIINQILMATIAFTLLVYPHLLATMLRAL